MPYFKTVFVVHVSFLIKYGRKCIYIYILFSISNKETHANYKNFKKKYIYIYKLCV